MNKKRGLSLLCVVLCMLLSLPAGAESPARLVMMGYDDAQTGRDWTTNLYFERRERESGISWEYRQYRDRDEYSRALKILAADAKSGGALPDVLFKAELSAQDLEELYAAGAIIDLRPYLEEACPNLSALLKDKPEALKAISLPTGEVLSLPSIERTPSQNCVWINRQWLERLKLPMPDSAESFVKTLRAFHEKDPNQNGRSDEIPFLFIGAYDLKYLAHAFGFAPDDFNLEFKDGELRYFPMEAGFCDFIRWCRDLYSEGLIDHNGFTAIDTLRQVTDSKAACTYGMIMGPLPSVLLPVEWSNLYQVMPPLQFEGKQCYRSIASSVVPGTFAVTTACKDVKKLLSWVDKLYSAEGAIMASVGLEGEDYVFDGDGTWRSMHLAGDTGFLSNGSISTGAQAPGLVDDAFQRLYTDSTLKYLSEEVDKVRRVAKDALPPHTLTRSDCEAIAPLQSELGRYVDESIARFVIGEWPVSDEEFGRFEQGLKDRGADELIRIFQNILTR